MECSNKLIKGAFPFFLLQMSKYYLFSGYRLGFKVAILYLVKKEIEKIDNNSKVFYSIDDLDGYDASIVIYSDILKLKNIESNRYLLYLFRFWRHLDVSIFNQNGFLKEKRRFVINNVYCFIF